MKFQSFPGSWERTSSSAVFIRVIRVIRGFFSSSASKLATLHDVHGWARLLVATRASVPGTAYPLKFAKEVTRHGEQVNRLWREYLRYHRNNAYLFEVDRIRNTTQWFLSQAEL